MNVSYRALQIMRELLCHDDPMCGAEIVRCLSIRSGTVYPLLARLKREQWIELAASIPSPEAPTAHFYRLTKGGRVAFLGLLCRLTIPDHLWREP